MMWETERPRGGEKLPLTNPFQYEYTGNFASAIRINGKVMAEIASFVGAKRPLIIRDGAERIERRGIAIEVTGSGITCSSSNDRKPPFEVVAKKDKVLLLINSQVIDGQSQDRQRDNTASKSSAPAYRDIFIDILKDVIVSGVEVWAAWELQNQTKWLPVFLQPKWWGLGVFIATYRQQLIVDLPDL